MTRVAFILIAALSSCSPPNQTGCPAIEKLAHRDAAADARIALARGDRRILMLGGFAGQTPGVVNADGRDVRMMEGTSDTETGACWRQGATAEAYAAKYNRTMVGQAGK